MVQFVVPTPLPIKKALANIENGTIRLPVFQRDFEWGTKNILRLLDSIFHNYPTGSLLTIGNRKELANKLFDQSTGTSNVELLILDGQQRLTSCYHVFYNKGDMTSKGRRYYFIDSEKLYTYYKEKTPQEFDKTDLYEEGIIFQKVLKKAPVNVTDDGLIPFFVLRDPELFSASLRAYKKQYEDDEEKYVFFDSKLRTLLSPFWDYEFQTLQLDNDLQLPAICRIFETLNNTGQRLDAFDICVARFMVDDIDIKEKLDKAINEFPNLRLMFKKTTAEGEKYINREFILQTIALFTGADNKKNVLAQSLDPVDLKNYWDKGIACLNCVPNILDCLAQTKKTLEFIPYRVSIPVMAAALLSTNYLDKKVDERAEIERKVRLYFLYTAFGERYGDSAPNKMKQDFEALTNWIKIGKVVNNDFESENVFKPRIEWKFEEFRKLKKSDKTSVTNAIRCLLYHHHPTDLFSNSVVNLETKNQHHLFPVDQYEQKFQYVDSILNIAYLENATNVYILNHSVPDYTRDIIKKVGEANFRKNMATHYVEGAVMDAFIEEDYDAFIKLRLDAIKEELITAYRAEIIDVTEQISGPIQAPSDNDDSEEDDEE